MGVLICHIGAQLQRPVPSCAFHPLHGNKLCWKNSILKEAQRGDSSLDFRSVSVLLTLHAHSIVLSSEMDSDFEVGGVPPLYNNRVKDNPIAAASASISVDSVSGDWKR